jgi:hypothetical protein
MPVSPASVVWALSLTEAVARYAERVECGFATASTYGKDLNLSGTETERNSQPKREVLRVSLPSCSCTS